ncbi:acetyl-CoA carboxylase biotin carboxylase subunit [Lunatibacter salilacus]|uniref:acetyl-CoA carboxylase biotin carboxylase subunit n=1 Tax=Lunatibacter salilacus TaxID=2483804 RepID=UPI00131CF9AC|nr:acetyl-CoA carboxylase biotin carboxylase subunit [Lunatibacter salilacus]
MQIQKLLIANRGEISQRIIRSAREMGIRTVAIYSEADRKAPFVRLADEAICIGPPPSNQSYLQMDRIIQVALDLQVDAIHPGYGFLSENASFAQKVADAGIIFVGPSPKAIATMGDKLKAKQAVSRYDIPLVPGTEESISDINKAKEIALEIGYPILIKASAGGGGKGMRIVENGDDFEEQMKRAVSEAQSAFGDPSVFIEKYISSPKHIEIQILGDQHGHIVHLFERECSIQRRHQKVVEEAPSGTLTQEVRQKMGEAAIKVAKACDYYGAGTVEFIVDEAMNFYFLEMNTRLQVEHPVTELITGKDLVREQLLIAEGKPLSFTQADLRIQGHAIEIRVYAEDPENNFLPDTGILKRYRPPMGPGIRVDDGFEEGMEIPVFYDPMISKLIVHDESREKAIRRMIRAIGEYQITGVKNTLSFCKFVMGHPEFRSAAFTTKFVDNYFLHENLEPDFTPVEKKAMAAFVGTWIADNQQNGPAPGSNTEERNRSPWKNRITHG